MLDMLNWMLTCWIHLFLHHSMRLFHTLFLLASGTGSPKTWQEHIKTGQNRNRHLRFLRSHGCMSSIHIPLYWAHACKRFSNGSNSHAVTCAISICENFLQSQIAYVEMGSTGHEQCAIKVSQEFSTTYLLILDFRRQTKPLWRMRQLKKKITCTQKMTN